MTTIYLVPSFHYDVAYLRTYREYLPLCLQILDDAVEPLDRHEDYHLMVEQVILLEEYWNHRPQHRQALRRFASQGRLTAAPGMSWAYKFPSAPCRVAPPPIPSLPMTWTPWRFMLVALAGWMDRQQQDVIA